MSNNLEIPSFENWLEKYFEKPKFEKIYKIKNSNKYLTENELLSKYKKAMGINIKSKFENGK